MEGFIELVIGMWVVAVAAFSPLGYFIYIFSKGDGHTFGKTDPDAHKVEDSKYYDLINNAMQKILGGSGTTSPSKKVTPAKSKTTSTAAVSNTASTAQSETPEPTPVISKGYGSTPAKR